MNEHVSSEELYPPTPSFVVDVPVLETLVDGFQSALDQHWPGSILSYSFKTNALPWLVNFMRERGAWAEVVSDTEYELALALGYAPDKIVYNGLIKSRDRLRSALLEGSIVNLDANRDIRWASELAQERPDLEIKVGLRINWDLEAYCPGQSNAGEDGSRFGFNEQSGELDRALDELAKGGVKVAGLHMHRNSRTQSVDVYRAAASLAADLIRRHDLDLDWVDIGGGFFGGINVTPTYADYVSAIREALDPVIDVNQTRLIVEPGGALVAVPFEFHASVTDVKNNDVATFVVTDASRTNIDPLFKRTKPFQIELKSDSTTTVPRQIISGFTYMESDRLMELTDDVELKEGDRIIFKKVGAYTLSHQPMFIEYLPAVYIRNAEGLTLVREKWNVNQFLQNNRWELAEAEV
ncbi:hypothetical protein ACXZ66_11335 [Corynebacterium sp. S7]